MDFECVIVKQEPVLSDEENGASPAADVQNGTISNIKKEIDEPDTNKRIKSEAPEAPTSQTAVPAGDKQETWHVPVTEEITIVPENLIQVSIKEEQPDEPDYYQHYQDPPSDDIAAIQASSSQNIYNNEFYSSVPTGGGYICHICHKTFANSGNVQRHLLIHTRDTLKCNQCDGQFISQMRLDRHIFSRHTSVGERVYPCDLCPKKFKSSSNLMQHKKTHLTDKPYKCPLCSKSFSFKTNLKKHQGKSRCKKPVDGPLECHVCNKVFHKEYLLKSHLRKHDNDRPFSCDQCSMHFKHKSTLIRHMQLHNGVRPFSCPVCNKTFTSSGLLKPHMRVHTGEKPYACEFCDKKFAHKHNMQRHMLGHEKVKHTVCDICHKQFPRESRLKYHMRTHTNEKHFACHVCPKRFSHRQNVLRHYTRKHPGQTYSCTDTDASVALKVWDSIKGKYDDDEAEVILG